MISISTRPSGLTMRRIAIALSLLVLTSFVIACGVRSSETTGVDRSATEVAAAVQAANEAAKAANAAKAAAETGDRERSAELMEAVKAAESAAEAAKSAAESADAARSAAKTASSKEETPPPVEAASDVTLTVYSGRSSSLVDPILQEFSTLTGIPVEVRYGSTGAIAATLLEEGDKSPADVFFAQDPGGLGVVEPLLGKLPQVIYETAPEWARDPDGKWVGISGRARVIVYNTANLSPEDLPESIWGFTDPKWKGRIGFPPTNASFHVMVTAMRLNWGEEKARLWLAGIMANEPKFYAKNTPTVAAAAAGEIDVGFVNHYYLHRFIAEEGEGFGARNYYTPAGDAGSLVMTAGVGILASSDAPAEAERLLTFLQGITAQQYFAYRTHEFPLNPNVPQSPFLPNLSEISGRYAVNLGDLSDIEGTQKLLQEVAALP